MTRPQDRADASRTSWRAGQAEDEPARVTIDIHTTCAETAERHGAPGDYVTGANIAGFERVADATLARGVI